MAPRVRLAPSAARKGSTRSSYLPPSREPRCRRRHGECPRRRGHGALPGGVEACGAAGERLGEGLGEERGGTGNAQRLRLESSDESSASDYLSACKCSPRRSLPTERLESSDESSASDYLSACKCSPRRSLPTERLESSASDKSPTYEHGARHGAFATSRGRLFEWAAGADSSFHPRGPIPAAASAAAASSTASAATFAAIGALN